jgi:methylenetetrahydrofolate reductase (NADPH)
VTYGAGGSTRERSHSTIARILNETNLTPAAHLTCVGAPKGEIDDVVARYHEVGVRHIVALRGDPSGGIGTAYQAHPDGYQSSADLVAGIRRRYPDIEVSVSAYPEKHPESTNFDTDIDMLQAKVDAGAARAITQVFFDNDLYLRYLDRVRARGIAIPIVPGIMPMHNFKQARGFVTKAGTTVPSWLADKFEGLDDDAETRKLVAATVAAGQVQKLAKHGVDTFHFYTMNRADLVFAISHLLGIRPNGARKAA